MAEEDASVYFFQNSTLEHYTRYTAAELKTTVLALEDLQLNTNGCCLNAIRDKYRQQKVKHILSGGV
jgi:cyclin A